MNDQDKFECRHQEIHDDNTNATITFGAHAGSGPAAPGGQPRKGLCWMRIAVPYADPFDPQKPGETKTSTITFGPDGQALKILPHVQAPDQGEDASVEDVVDKVPKRAKK